MENCPEPIAAPAEKENVSIISKILKVLAYPVSALTGFMVANTEVTNSAYETVKGFGGMNDLLAKHDPQASEAVAQRVAGTLPREEFLARSMENKTGYSQSVTKRMEQLGIGDFGGKWRYISRGRKQKAILEGLTISGITIGAMLTIANSKSLTNLFAPDRDEGNKTP